MSYNFLIYISYSYALPIGNPLEFEILKRGYAVKWFSDEHEGQQAIINKSNTLRSIKDVIAYNPTIILAVTNNVPDFINALKVQVFHGFLTYKRPEKNNKDAHFRIRGFFDLYCTQGPTTTSGFRDKQKAHPHFEVIETGWSKVDSLFPLKKNKIKNTILIASTFTERLSLAYNGSVYSEIKRLSSLGLFNFFMVLHPKIPANIKQKWETLNGKHFTYIDTTDIIPLFKEADIMFADTTSAIQEFLLQQKPVVTYNHTFKHKYLIDVNNASDLQNAFNEAFSFPKELLKNIGEFVENLHPYNDGESSKRIISATIEFLHKDKNYLKKKPLNLIRKFKIRKRLNYFTLKTFNEAFTVKIDD